MNDGLADRGAETSRDQLAVLSARRHLLDLEEIRMIRTAADAGMTQAEIALAVGRSQPTVSRILNRLGADPGLISRRPLEVIAEAVAGACSRGQMRDRLMEMGLRAGRRPPNRYMDGFIPDAWGDIVQAWECGWVSDAEYEDLAKL